MAGSMKFPGAPPIGDKPKGRTFDERQRDRAIHSGQGRRGTGAPKKPPVPAPTPAAAPPAEGYQGPTRGKRGSNDWE